eukprot:scaffold200826_cov32-Attheya_sp.AAC.1
MSARRRTVKGGMETSSPKISCSVLPTPAMPSLKWWTLDVLKCTIKIPCFPTWTIRKNLPSPLKQ